MKVSVVTAPGETQVVDAPKPKAGPADVLVKIRACGICGTDALFISMGGIPGHDGGMPKGHEPAGEVVDVGALSEYLLIENAARGKSPEVVPEHIPFEVAALNEPMAVARHGVNQCQPQPGDKVVIFGAGPIGLGATIAFKSLGVSHVVVADLIPGRLEKALKVGADAVINSGEEDVAKRLLELHGEGASMWGGKAGTDIYFDAAGVPAVIETALAAAKTGARLGVVAVHKQPVPVDFLNLMSNEITIVGSMGYPDEIFEVTEDLIANWERYAVIISHTIPFDDVNDALKTATTPGAADKVVVTFN
jgi:threonine dehydrogenase-like Zn-dependent dehydrogenase